MTSIRIDAGLAERLIASQFPQWAHLPVRPVAVGGWNNKTFHLGDRLLIRLPRAAAYAAQVEKEQRWLPALAPHLPLPIPTPVGLGAPDESYPWAWSIYEWIDGDTAAGEDAAPSPAFATALAAFLAALQSIGTAGGPAPGAHNFHRGGALSTYDDQSRAALARLEARFDRAQATAIWDDALAQEWDRPPVWVHGDVAAGNLLVRDGTLCAVIDFGGLGVGDPACDLAVSWALFDDAARFAFRAALPLDPATWARGRGWALWKALILATGLVGGHPRDVADADRVLEVILADHRRAG